MACSSCGILIAAAVAVAKFLSLIIDFITYPVYYVIQQPWNRCTKRVRVR